jgi:MFS family permease
MQSTISASLLQPLIGLYADAHPKPYILPIGVCFTLVGIVALALADSYPLILIVVILIGIMVLACKVLSSIYLHFWYLQL